MDITAQATVTGGSTGGKPPEGIDPNNRRVQFNLITNGPVPEKRLQQIKEKWDGSPIWIVTHGWNGNVDPNGSLGQVARTIKAAHPNAIVLTLDWSEAAKNTYGTPFGIPIVGSIIDFDAELNGHAATWIGTVADWAYQKLKEWGVSDGSSINFVGHSLGSFLSSEIAAQFGKVNTITALDPANDDNLTSKFKFKYDLDQRDPAENPPQQFDAVADFSRAFVGGKNVLENLSRNSQLASTAHESILMDFDTQNPSTHTWVVQAFRQLIDSAPDQVKLANGLFSLDDYSKHSEFREDAFGETSFSGRYSEREFEGIIRVNQPDQPLFFIARDPSDERDGIVYGTTHDDLIFGLKPDGDFYKSFPPYSDEIFDNNSTFYVGDGSDIVDAGTGDDRIFGGQGDDHLLGDMGNDTLVGGLGIDALVGSSDSDTFIFNAPSEGIDHISLFSEEDIISVSAAGFGGGLTSDRAVTSDEFFSGAGVTTPTTAEQRFLYDTKSGFLYFDADGNGTSSATIQIAVLERSDYLYKQPLLSNNQILINDQESEQDDQESEQDDRINWLVGGGGNDRLTSRAGADAIIGGDGVDTALYTDSNTGVSVNLSTGEGKLGDAEGDTLQSIENLEGSQHGDTLTGDAASNNLLGWNGQDILSGQAGQDTLDGGNDNDTLDGGTEDDILYGENGNDSLDGGLGNDSMLGSMGNDIYVVERVTDQVTESANQGRDTAKSSITYTLGENLENLILTEKEPINGMGNNLENIILGNDAGNFLFGDADRDILSGGDGDDTLDGGVKNDAMAGGLGSDTYTVDGSADQIIESENEGIDTVNASASYVLSSNLENLNLTGSSVINGKGNSLVNIINGNAAVNYIHAGEGADLISGAAGNDYIYGEAGDDSILGDEGGDNLNGGTGNDVVVGSKGRDWLVGDFGNDQLLGGAGKDHIMGGMGDDVIIGGADKDWLTGGAGADQFVFHLRKDEADTITDFRISDGDRITVSAKRFGKKLELGKLSADRFILGSAATNASDRFIYDSYTGKLFFDADGNGKIEQIQLTTLSKGLSLTNQNIVITA